MAEDQLLKSVRITDNIKVDVYQQGKKRKYALFNDSDNSYINNRRLLKNINTKSEKYDIAMTDDEVIEMALEAYNRKFGTPSKKYYITQKVYSEPSPVRLYGNGEQSPYYLNNGCALNIRWVGQIPNPDFVLGTFSNVDDAEEATGIKSYLQDVTVTSTVDDATDTSKMPSASWGKSFVSRKEVTITLPKGFTENGGKGYLVWTNNGLQYNDKALPAGTDNGNAISYFQNHTEDARVIEVVLSYFEGDISSLHGIAANSIGLSLCHPDTEACSLIPYKSPLEPPNSTKDQLISNDTPPGPSQSVPKLKLTIDGLPDVVQVKAKVNLPEFTIWTGPIPKPKELSDTYDEENSLDPQYLENDYAGPEETGLDLTTWKVQDAVSNSQLDSDANGGTVGSPADIKPYSSFDQLIELAGKCARELGKNARVNAENMKKGYTKGIHGLCPQGTQAVLYALTGVKAVGKLSGNADYFSFGPTNPSSSSRSSFANTGYYNDKVKISQINGSWKGTYLHKDSKSMWQVGDVIAMAYSGGKNYGHIQVWTGFSWMSDFKQGNSIQQNHVNVDSVALWRLNEKGIAAVKKQQGNLA